MNNGPPWFPLETPLEVAVAGVRSLNEDPENIFNDLALPECRETGS